MTKKITKREIAERKKASKCWSWLANNCRKNGYVSGSYTDKKEGNFTILFEYRIIP